MPSQKHRLSLGQCPSLDGPIQERVLFRDLSELFPQFEESAPTAVSQVPGSARNLLEVLEPDLTPADRTDHKSVDERCSKFFDKVKGKRWSAGSETMQKPDLVVHADGVDRADRLVDQQSRS